MASGRRVFVVEKWLTRKPDFAKGKFIMLVFWNTSSDASRRAIPLLNSFLEKYHDRLVIIGISDESEDVMRAASCPPIEYPVCHRHAGIHGKGIGNNGRSSLHPG